MKSERKKNRLPCYDYSLPGYYYVTICTHKKKRYLGKFNEGELKLSDIGLICENFWKSIPIHFPETELDEFIIMPNHIHGILIINGVGNADKKGNVGNADKKGNVGNADLHSLQENNDRTKMLLSKCIQQFKSSVTRFINQKGIKNNFRWQKSFYERIIRNERELYFIRRYIRQNPLSWSLEKENIENLEL